jgi:hypothetical protein
MNGTKDNWWKAMIVVTLILLVFDLAVTLDNSGKMKPGTATPEQNFSLPCDTIPVRFLIEDPVCGVKLLDALNESTLRVDPRNATAIDKEIERQTQYWVGKYIQRHTKNE